MIAEATNHALTVKKMNHAAALTYDLHVPLEFGMGVGSAFEVYDTAIHHSSN